MYIRLAGRKFMLFLEQLGMFSWNFVNINKIEKKLLSYMRYLRMLKLSFPNTTNNLLTKFRTEESIPSICSTPWYKVKFMTYTGVKLIGYLFNLITWFCVETVSTFRRNQSVNVVSRHHPSRTITSSSFNSIPYVEVKTSRNVYSPSSPFNSCLFKELNVQMVET